MSRTTTIRLGLLALPLLALALPAQAQSSAPNDQSNVHLGGMLQKHAPKPGLPPVAAPPSAWPRLDPGAVLCRSEGDLQRRAAMLRGESAGPADCQPITQPTAVRILDRAGPGATEVQVTGQDQTGWTDAWLPATPPPGTNASR